MPYKFNPFTGNLDIEGPVLTGSGTVSAAADGTQSIPGISFASDLNTGIYRPGADQLGISTGGTERARIDSSGNVEIGGTLPSSPNITLNANGTGTFTGQLTLEGSSTPFRFGITDRGGQINLYQVGSISNAGIELEAVHSIASEVSFKTQGTRRITIDRDGDLLIGGTLPSSPNTNLSTDGSATFAGSVSIGGTAAANTIDEYEEGTWTPVHSDATNSATLNGLYRKIGSLVYLRISATGTGTLKVGSVSGLPFTNIATIVGTGGKVIQSTSATSDTSVVGYNANAAAINLNLGADVSVVNNVSSWTASITAVTF